MRISQKTLRSYLRLYQDGGLAALKKLKFHQPSSELEAHRERLQAEFEARPAKSINEAAERIEKLTDIRRSPTQVGVFLKKLGLKRRKVGHVPAKADPAAQQTFLKKNCNHAWKKPNKGSGTSSLSMRLIL